MEQQSFSLYELNSTIKKLLKEIFLESLWIRAQISEIHTNANGHCYIELIEYDTDRRVIARQKATIWATTYKMLRPYFEQTAGYELQAGLEILVCCTIEMHESYGLSLNIIDINPEYTTGKIALDKEKILNRLSQDGVIELNRSLQLPALPRRIAVISSATAAGYEDFCHQINNNPYGYRFHTELFDARMQGNETEQSVTAALDTIFERADEFDAVVIIRGGGATSDLSAFDNYNIATAIAQFPLPVVCGIGHLRDETVSDIVAYKSVKTPTAAAEFFVDIIREQEERLVWLTERIRRAAATNVERQKTRINTVWYRLHYLPKEILVGEYHRLDRQLSLLLTAARQTLRSSQHRVNYLQYQVLNYVRQRTDTERHRIHLIEQRLEATSPTNTLRRGFAIIRQNGKTVRSAKALDIRQAFQIVFHDGTIDIDGDSK
jgi:exodeoxyribonuclease VII, large subunit